MKTKICKICNVEKSIIDFYKEGSDFRRMCKKCDNERRKQYPSRHNSQKCKLYREKNKESILEKRKIYYNQTKEKFREREREYYKTHPKKMKEIAIKKRKSLRGRMGSWKGGAKNRKIEWNLDYDFLSKLPMICFYTGEPLTLEQKQLNTVSLDRIDSSQGYNKNNVVFCCSIINTMKTELSIEDFKKWCKKVVDKDAKPI